MRIKIIVIYSYTRIKDIGILKCNKMIKILSEN